LDLASFDLDVAGVLPDRLDVGGCLGVLAKQAKGKKRMRRFGKVDIPAEAFTVMLKRD
jgi:translation elongation factor EF-4